MKRASKIEVTLDDIVGAAYCAMSGHSRQPEVKNFKDDVKGNCKRLYDAYLDETYMKYVHYDILHKVNTNGKRRVINRPNFDARIYQWLVINKLRPLYEKKDPHVGLNCKPDCGIQGKAVDRVNGEKVNKDIPERLQRKAHRRDRRNSVLKRVKHLCYDEREYECIVSIDQRKCYDHIHERHFRKAIKNLSTDKKFNDFAVAVSYVDDKLPVGTPTSPFVHHVIMLEFDIWLLTVSDWAIRYADNVLAAFRTKEEAQCAVHRIANFWWYALGFRAKRNEITVQPLTEKVRFCGYTVKRCDNKKITEHGKGYTRIRKNILVRAGKSTKKGWGSYFGLLRHADEFCSMRKIEHDMKLSQLTESIRINRELDAVHIDMKDLVGSVIEIRDYELRSGKDNVPNWVKLLVAIPDKDRRVLAREVHGGYKYIVEYLTECEKKYGGKEAILPIEEVEIVESCGYIFKGSTNQISYFN